MPPPLWLVVPSDVANVLSSEVGLSPTVNCLSVSLPLWLVVPSCHQCSVLRGWTVTNCQLSECLSTLVAGGPLMSPMFCPQRLDCHQLSSLVNCPSASLPLWLVVPSCHQCSVLRGWTVTSCRPLSVVQVPLYPCGWRSPVMNSASLVTSQW